MRVVAGEHRGRRLVAPAGTGTRPTSDRVREAIFNVLTSAAGGLDGYRVLDLFAGSGALGIEALSRGAAHVTFVEQARAAAATVRRNLDELGIGEDRATVVVGDALRHVAVEAPVDLVLADPPYAFDAWPALLARLDAELAVLESDREPPLTPPWECVREKRYGTTVVTLVRRTKGGQ